MSSIPENAEELFNYDDVSCALRKLAQTINSEYQNYEGELLVITLLNGGMIFSGMLLPQIKRELYCDSVSVSRYRNEKSGSDFRWHFQPVTTMHNRKVLLLDDIYDQGITLEHVQEWCYKQGADQVKTAVLAWKQLGETSQKAVAEPDFYALQVPDAFIVGMGMDCAGKYRNAPGIYALNS
ncbi:hypoxanthine phosphoribosyltransferase [Alteromonadaceae bacterium 2753L.S.0a.02]|nr:hypoxanthine phosphoribosyltransferase [Alteromonadaceae bacterium 2753L.S.0a.02]